MRRPSPSITWRIERSIAAFETRGLVIHDGDRTDDIRRLEAALEALKRHRLPLLEWRVCVVDDTACQDGQSDWVVWLSAAEPSGDRDGARLYRPEAGEWADAVSDPRFPERLTRTVLSEAQQRQAWGQVPVSAAALAVGALSFHAALARHTANPFVGCRAAAQ